MSHSQPFLELVGSGRASTLTGHFLELIGGPGLARGRRRRPGGTVSSLRSRCDGRCLSAEALVSL
jgi:hypothetical protein